MNIIGLIGIFVALALLIILVYKGVHVVVAGSLGRHPRGCDNGLGATNGYGTIYLSGMGGFITANLPIYLWGGIFGELFNASGAARSIAKAISRLLKGKKEHTGVLTSILIVFIAGYLDVLWRNQRYCADVCAHAPHPGDTEGELYSAVYGPGHPAGRLGYSGPVHAW